MITPPPAAPANPEWDRLTANCIASLPTMPGHIQDLYLCDDARPWPDAGLCGSVATRVSIRAIADAIRARRAAHPEWAGS